MLITIVLSILITSAPAPLADPDDPVAAAFGGKWTAKDFRPLTPEEADKIRCGPVPPTSFAGQKAAVIQSYLRQPPLRFTAPPGRFRK